MQYSNVLTVDKFDILPVVGVYIKLLHLFFIEAVNPNHDLLLNIAGVE